MAKLGEILLGAGRRAQVVDDCVSLIDDEVAAKSGLGGLAVKGAYAVVKAVKPGVIREAADRLLDDLVAALEPFYADFRAQPRQPLETYFHARAGEIAEALLGVADARAAHAKHPAVKKAYAKLRPSGRKHTEAAVDGVARLIRKHGG